MRSTSVELAGLLNGTMAQIDPIRRGYFSKQSSNTMGHVPPWLCRSHICIGDNRTLLVREVSHTTGPMRASACWLYSKNTGGLACPHDTEVPQAFRRDMVFFRECTGILFFFILKEPSEDRTLALKFGGVLKQER